MPSRNRFGAKADPGSANPDVEVVTPPHQSTEKESRLPFHNGGAGQGQKSRADSETRRGFNPLLFFWICFRSTSRLSMAVNVLWPVVPAAIAVHFALDTSEENENAPRNHLIIFILNYIAMVPAANTIGFSGQELARKMPHVLGVLIETAFGSIVEIILFIVLVVKKQIYVVRDAILGSLLANMLLCLGLCFIAGSIHQREQVFHEVISEVGSGLMLVASSMFLSNLIFIIKANLIFLELDVLVKTRLTHTSAALILPAAFAGTITSDLTNENGVLVWPGAEARVLGISRAAAVILLAAFFVYIYFNMSSHHSLVTELFEAEEERDRDKHKDAAKEKLTLTECIVALAISITCVSMIAVFLVLEIEPIVTERGVPDAFMGLILIPLVEKVAEHLTAIDEAFDYQSNLALAHVLGASIQTALLNTPIVVIVGWGLAYPMDLNFLKFEAILLILAVLIVGNFLRDGKANYLEGVLCVFVYILIAVAAWYYPNPGLEEHFQQPPQEAAHVPERLLFR